MSNTASETSLSGDILRYIRYQLRGRRGLIVAAIAIGLAALWFSWPWLAVAGIAPILIAIAPCAIICALGLCGRHLFANANQGDAGSSLSSSGASCCARPQQIDETVASTTADDLTERLAEPAATAVSSQAGQNSVDDPDGTQPEPAGQSGATIDQEKEKFQ